MPSEERAPDSPAPGEDHPPVPRQRFLNNRLTTRQAVGYATATVLLTLVLIPTFTTVLE
jgi:hypothetical protein